MVVDFEEFFMQAELDSSVDHGIQRSKEVLKLVEAAKSVDAMYQCYGLSDADVSCLSG